MMIHHCQVHILQDRDTVLHHQQLDTHVRNLLQDTDLPHHLRQDRQKRVNNTLKSQLIIVKKLIISLWEYTDNR